MFGENVTFGDKYHVFTMSRVTDWRGYYVGSIVQYHDGAEQREVFLPANTSLIETLRLP